MSVRTKFHSSSDFFGNCSLPSYLWPILEKRHGSPQGGLCFELVVPEGNRMNKLTSLQTSTCSIQVGSHHMPSFVRFPEYKRREIRQKYSP